MECKHVGKEKTASRSLWKGVVKKPGKDSASIADSHPDHI